MKDLIKLAALAAAVVASSVSFAADTADTIKVKSSVNKECYVNFTGGQVAFVAKSALEQSVGIQIKCNDQKNGMTVSLKSDMNGIFHFDSGTAIPYKAAIVAPNATEIVSLDTTGDTAQKPAVSAPSAVMKANTDFGGQTLLNGVDAELKVSIDALPLYAGRHVDTLRVIVSAQ